MTRWISIEGINGVGKTHLTEKVKGHLGANCFTLDELTDRRGDDLNTRVIQALHAEGDFFLRTGHPGAETLALMALKVRDYEHVQQLDLPTNTIVLEDRGPHTVAAYQAVIVWRGRRLDETKVRAKKLLQDIEKWRPLPDVTVLVVDGLDACMTRLQQRTGVPLSVSDRALVETVDHVYSHLVGVDPRMLRLDRRFLSETQLVNQIADVCNNKTIQSRSCAR